jgi:hypothetical protein
MDKLPQRVLVHKLKRAIDLIPRDSQAVTRVRQLASENPHSVRSTHVTRNLGSARVATLHSIIGEPPAHARAALPLDHEATRNS